MWVFYLISLLPLLVGAYLWINNKKVVWWEWGIAVLIGFVLSLIFHYATIWGLSDDVESWSGQITQVQYHPEWVERYTEIHHHSSGTGKNRRTWTTTDTHYRTHSQYWYAESTLSAKEISRTQYEDIKARFGGSVISQRGGKSGFWSGDPNIYITNNGTGYVYPVVETRHFENRVKATPSLWSFPPVEPNAPVFEYPTNNWTSSGRLVGTAINMIDLREFDQLNSRLGPSCKVNVIMIGFSSDSGMEIAIQQQSKWIGGKKNDLVLCYSVRDSKTQWAYCFGWTEAELVKQNLQGILLNNKIDTSILPKIEKEIRTNYVIKDWKKFEYLTIEPPSWGYWVFFLVLAIVQSGWWYWCHINEFGKDGVARGYSSYRRYYG